MGNFLDGGKWFGKRRERNELVGYTARFQKLHCGSFFLSSTLERQETTTANLVQLRQGGPGGGIFTHMREQGKCFKAHRGTVVWDFGSQVSQTIADFYPTPTKTPALVVQSRGRESSSRRLPFQVLRTTDAGMLLGPNFRRVISQSSARRRLITDNHRCCRSATECCLAPSHSITL